MVVATMPKKKPVQDGRSTRYAPMSLADVQQLRDKLQSLAGVYTAICSEMQTRNLEQISVDGIKGVHSGIRNIASMARKCKGELTAIEFDLG